MATKSNPGGWLFKEEPDHYSYDDLERDGQTVWNGISNPVALKNLRATQVGDRVYFPAGDGVAGVITRDLSALKTVDLDGPVTAVAPTPSGDRIYAAVRGKRNLPVIDRYTSNVAATVQLPANLARTKMPATPAGASQDSFSGNDDGYMGPGAPGNVYEFWLYALSVASYTPPDAENRESVHDELQEDPDDIVLGTSVLRGRSNPDGYN